MEYVLKTENLTKVYGSYKAVNRIHMHIPKGAIYGFIGKNGAGKTTFMRMVAGLAAPTEGSIELFGSKELVKERKRIGTLIEHAGIFANMTAKENLEIVKRCYGIKADNAVDEMLAFVGLEGCGKKKVKNFSMGMKQRLGIAISLLRTPDLLILDEPINGLDPEGIREIRELIIKLNKERGITILISSHILGELSKIATHYGIIRNGELIDEFEADGLQERCRKCQKIFVDNETQAVKILEEKLHIQNYDIPQSGTIRVFECLDMQEQMNRELILGGVNIKESFLSGQDLEGYFMDLLGGGENA